jgi:hypothetical protein
MRTELRVLLVVGLAVGLWLLVAPVPSADGSGCGLPIAGLGSDDVDGRAEDCPARNSTRVTQAAWLLVPLPFIAAIGHAVRHREPDRPDRGQRGHWE